MASEEDNFDIDIYGDADEEYPRALPEDEKLEPGISATNGYPEIPVRPNESPTGAENLNDEGGKQPVAGDHSTLSEAAQKIASTDQSSTDLVQLPKQAPQTQGIKRKEGVEDDRPVGPGATTALFVSDLHWWITDDDIRGWANQSQCEDELEDVTFNEHKVNGKSKGQVYAIFKTNQAATAVKQKIESFGEGQQYAKRFTVNFSNPHNNPFKTLPKDGPARNNPLANNSRSNTGASSAYGAGGYRGGRGGGYNSRGGGSNFNRGGFPNQFQGSGMSNFAQMGPMPSYGGFQNRGGMVGGMRGTGIGIRGGRGGMMGMPMNMNMNMGGMAMGMGMPQMGAMGMGGANGFQGNAGNFNSMFNQQQQGSSGYGIADHPHPAKRTRQD